jgi:multidrug resistance efflux pump
VQRLLQPPGSAVRLAGWLVVGLPLLSVLLLVTPWRQTALGSGEVVAWSPEERSQTVDAPVQGRIASWAVREGDKVEVGQLLVSLVDNDPDYLERLLAERDAVQAQLQSLHDQESSYRAKREAKVRSRDLVVAEYDAKVLGLEQKLAGERAELETDRLQFDRIALLEAEGLASERTRELAVLEVAKGVTVVDARLAEIRGTVQAREKARQSLDAEVATVEAELQALEGKVAETRAKLVAVESKLARQNAQEVLAPRAGQIQRLHGGPGGAQVKEGDLLVEFVPETTDRVVSLYLDGNDVPLVQAGDPVRLIFEGWPALQFGGWPEASLGTFPGRVAFVDTTDDGKGNFRIMVEPESPEDWPSTARLRQGVRAKGWILLSQVSLGYELWRQINGFPPLPDVEKGEKPLLPGNKKPRAPVELK